MQELVTIILADESDVSTKCGLQPGYKICGMPIWSYITDAVKQTGANSIIMVSNNIPDESNKIIDTNINFTTEKNISEIIKQVPNNKTKNVLLIIGANLPVITGKTLLDAYKQHVSKGKQITVLTYDNSERQLNAGIYFFNIDTILSILD